MSPSKGTTTLASETTLRSYRPGGGEYAERTGEWFSAASYLRGLFMSIAFERMPDLEKQLRAIYEEAHLSEQYDRLRQLNPNSLTAKFDLERTVLRPWAERWNLTDHWCIAWVSTQKITRWYEVDQRDIPGIGRWGTAEIGPRRFETEPFKMPGWDPTEKTRDAFKAEIRRGLKAVLDVYCTDIERRIESIKTWSDEANKPVARYVRSPELRQPEHFLWLVAFQVCRASFKSISDAVSHDRHPVQLAITKLARKIGLSLRPTSDYLNLPHVTLQNLLRGM